MLTPEQIQKIIIKGVMKYSSLDIPLRRQKIDMDIALAAYKKGQEDLLKRFVSEELICSETKAEEDNCTECKLFWKNLKESR